MSLEPASEPTLLIVDDDAIFRSALGEALGRNGFAVHLAGSAEEAVATAREHVFEYALVDVRMPGQSGIELVGALRTMDDGILIVDLSKYLAGLDRVTLGHKYFLQLTHFVRGHGDIHDGRQVNAVDRFGTLIGTRFGRLSARRNRQESCDEQQAQ